MCRLFKGIFLLPEKWNGTTSVELKSLASDQVWSALADYCNFHKWYTNLDTCYRVEGVLGQPGLVRYCASPPTDPSDKTSILWHKATLLVIDPIKRCLSYEFNENNMGFKSYVATVQVVPLVNEVNGCRVEWSFVCDPIVGWSLDDFVAYIKSAIQLIERNLMEHYALPSSIHH